MSDYVAYTTNDTNQLSNNLEEVVSENNIVPMEILADKGYANSQQILEIEGERQTKCYIPFPETKRDKQER